MVNAPILGSPVAASPVSFPTDTTKSGRRDPLKRMEMQQPTETFLWSSPPDFKTQETKSLSRNLMRTPAGRRLALEQVLEQIGPEARHEILGSGKLARQLEPAIGPALSPNSKPFLLEASATSLAKRFIQFTATDLIAFSQEMGNPAVTELVRSAVQDKKFHPLKLYALHKQVRKSFKAQQAQEKARKDKASQENLAPGDLRFAAGVDPFGVTFVVGLATYAYGKIQNNKAAKNLGKTLLLIGVIPNLILLGMAMSAFLKVAFNNGFGFF